MINGLLLLVMTCQFQSTHWKLKKRQLQTETQSWVIPEPNMGTSWQVSLTLINRCTSSPSATVKQQRFKCYGLNQSNNTMCKAWCDLVRDHNLQAMNKHPSMSSLLRLTFMIMVNPVHNQECLALCSRHSQHQHKHMRPYSSFKLSCHLYHKSPCFWQQILSAFEFLVIICYCHLAHFNYTFKEQPKRTRNPLTSEGQKCQKTEVTWTPTQPESLGELVIMCGINHPNEYFAMEY